MTGYCKGDLTLMLRNGESYRTDLDLTMTALGLRGNLVSGELPGRPMVSFESDVLLVHTTSDADFGPSGLLAATEAGVSRVRLGLEGSFAFSLYGGGSIRPELE